MAAIEMSFIKLIACSDCSVRLRLSPWRACLRKASWPSRDGTSLRHRRPVAGRQRAPAVPIVGQAHQRPARPEVVPRESASSRLELIMQDNIAANNHAGLELRAVIEMAPYNNIMQIARQMDDLRANGVSALSVSAKSN